MGRGERDEAPSCTSGKSRLFRPDSGEQGSGPRIDIALDPLEGTTITAKAGPNALAVLAVAEQGGLLNAPDTYMDKLAIGPGYPEGTIDLGRSPSDNIRAVAAAKGVDPSEIIVCVLDRPRHDQLIAELRGIGCGIQLIPDGDVAGVIATTNPEVNCRRLYGTGGAPRAYLQPAALRCVGGQMQGRLLFRTTTKSLVPRWGSRTSTALFARGHGQGRLHLRRDRCHRRVAARWRASPQVLPDHREHRHAGKLGNCPPRACRAPQGRGLKRPATAVL